MIKTTVKLSRFYDALDAYSQGSKKSWESLFLKQCEQIGKQIVMVTPPMQANRLGKDSFAVAKRRGQAAVQSDILRVFSPFNKNFASRFGGKAVVKSESDMERIHMQNRVRGRVKGKVRDIPAQRNILTAYIKRKKKMVGYLGSGWNPLAGQAKVRGIPSWIKDKDAGGDAKIIANNQKLKFLATNRARFASSVRGVDRYIQIAVDQQAINLWKQVRRNQERLQARMTARTK
jgi:hypothetical protein